MTVMRLLRGVMATWLRVKGTDKRNDPTKMAMKTMIGEAIGQEMDAKVEKEDEANLQEVKAEKETEIKIKTRILNSLRSNLTRTTMMTKMTTMMNQRTLMTIMRLTLTIRALSTVLLQRLYVHYSTSWDWPQTLSCCTSTTSQY